MSKNYKKTLKKIHKWINKKNNKIKNEYHHLSKNLVEKYDIISMETLNIKGMLKNKKWAPKMQHLQLPIHQPNNRHTKMDMPHMRNKTSKRHKRSKKHPKTRQTKNKNKNLEKK